MSITLTGTITDLANRIELVPYQAENPNALVPIHLDIQLKDGTSHTHELVDVYGAPAKPMSREAHLEKFRGNCNLANTPLPEAKAERLIELVDGLDELQDLTEVLDCLVP